MPVALKATGTPATSSVHYTTSCNTQSSALEDGRDHRPKHVELIGIVNKLLLLHLVGVYIISVSGVTLCRSVNRIDVSDDRGVLFSHYGLP